MKKHESHVDESIRESEKAAQDNTLPHVGQVVGYHYGGIDYTAKITNVIGDDLVDLAIDDHPDGYTPGNRERVPMAQEATDGHWTKAAKRKK